MPRNGAGVFSLPAVYLVASGDTLLPAQHNDPFEDLETDMNTARPIVAGGTGATTAADARTNLGLDAAALEDYEEGTFTPTIVGGSTAGTGTYSVQVGRYTKIGRLVHISIRLEWSAHTGTGAMSIQGLPFTTLGNTANALAFHHSDVALTAGNVLTGFPNSSATIISLRQVPTGGGTAATVPIDTAGVLLINASYETS